MLGILVWVLGQVLVLEQSRDQERRREKRAVQLGRPRRKRRNEQRLEEHAMLVWVSSFFEDYLAQ
jgi:hypothetical protein